MNTSQYCSFNSFTSTARTAALDEREWEGVSLQENSHHKYYKCGNCPSQWVFTVSLFSLLSLSLAFRKHEHRTCTCHKSLMPQHFDSGNGNGDGNNGMMNHCVEIYWQLGRQNGWRTRCRAPCRAACSVPAQTGTGLITAFKSHRSGAQRSLRSQSPVSGAYISIYTYVYSTYIVSVYVCVYIYVYPTSCQS